MLLQASRVSCAVVIHARTCLTTCWDAKDKSDPKDKNNEARPSGQQLRVLNIMQKAIPQWELGCAVSYCLERRLGDAYILLEPERPLGVGGHGVVFPGVNRSSGEIMAIKQVSKKFASDGKAKEEALRRRVATEAEVIRIAGEHRSICTYKELFEGEDAWYIVTELARGGELFDRLVERGAYTASGAASVMRELVDAVAYLHQIGIAHLDLKPENVLLASDETDASDVRLVDFGSARFLAPTLEIRSHASFRGSESKETIARHTSASEEDMQQEPAGATPAYAAPEVLRRVRYDEKADIWSLGVILYLLLTGTHPFDPTNDADDEVVTQRVIQGAAASGAFEGSNWSRVPRAVRPLLRRLLALDPNDRPSAAEVSAHPWIVAPESKAALALADEEAIDEGDAFVDEASAQAAVDKLREFHRGRRRFKALLLAVMLGHADEALRLEHGKGTACLGSRRAAMDVFDADGDGIVTHADVQRVARYLGEELSGTDINEMMRAVDHHCRPRHEAGVPTARLRHLLPPLYPAHILRRGEIVFSAAEVDPRFYVLLSGDVLISHSFNLRSRSGYVHSASDHVVAANSDGAKRETISGTESSRRRSCVEILGYELCLSPVPEGSGQQRRGNDGKVRDEEFAGPITGRSLSLGLHRIQAGQSFGETELLEVTVPGALPRASTATCASNSCELLSIPGHLFQLLSDVFDGVQEPLRLQAENRAKSLVWSWVSALVAQGSDSDIASRRAYSPDQVAWSNREYAAGMSLERSWQGLQRNNPDGVETRHEGHKSSSSTSSSGKVKQTQDDAFIVVEDGVVEVTVADTRTGNRRTHTLWPRDFVYCNERPGDHPLDARKEFSSTIIVDVRAVTQAQLALVHGNVFQQALTQPAMCVPLVAECKPCACCFFVPVFLFVCYISHEGALPRQFVKLHLVERFREFPGKED